MLSYESKNGGAKRNGKLWQGQSLFFLIDSCLGRYDVGAGPIRVNVTLSNGAGPLRVKGTLDKGAGPLRVKGTLDKGAGGIT